MTSGEIINAAGDRSRAQDLVVYDPNVVAGWQIDDIDAVIPAEAVVATIEVKSGGAKRDVQDAATNLASVKSVFGHRPRSGLAGDLLIDQTHDRPLGVAIFYDAGRSWQAFTDDVVEVLRQAERELRPDVFVVPGVGAVTWPPDSSGKPLRGRTDVDEMLTLAGADTMLSLVYLISSHVRTWVPPQLNVWDYARGQPSGLDLAVTPRPPN